MRMDCLLSHSRRSFECKQIGDAAHAENLHQVTQAWKINPFTCEAYSKRVLDTLAVFVGRVFSGEANRAADPDVLLMAANSSIAKREKEDI